MAANSKKSLKLTFQRMVFTEGNTSGLKSSWMSQGNSFEQRRSALKRMNQGGSFLGMKDSNFCYVCGLIRHSERECSEKKESSEGLEKEKYQYGAWLCAELVKRTNFTLEKPDEAGSQFSSQGWSSEGSKSNLSACTSRDPTYPLEHCVYGMKMSVVRNQYITSIENKAA